MKITKTKDSLTQSLKKLDKNLIDIPEKAYKFWVDTTPKASGNARKKTKLNRDTIHANYQYAQRLDDGWSQKAPNGMSQPLARYLNQLLKRFMRK